MSDEQNALNLHNEARARLGVAPLTWSSSLTEAARRWAQTLAQRDSGLEHDPNRGDAGENAASMSPPNDHTLAQSAQMWISERDSVPYVYGVFQGGQAGHYTQVVWENTKEVGIAAATSKSGSVYVIGRYSPPGNFLGQFPYQIHQGGNHPPPPPPPPPHSGGNDGLMFLNGNRGGQHVTMVAWYSKLEPNLSRAPDAKVEGSIPLWEGREESVRFPDGNVLSWHIPSNAQSQSDFSEVGTAHNNFRSFKVFKDSKRQAFVLDGVAWRSIYWAQ